ncbi:MAG: NUDIX domain-containing protein [Clostridia bacterium]|nr:NUDIX domain-containing protein [Clostridia bacterium]
MINSKNKILVQRRALNKKVNPGLYGVTGGHVDAGETPIATCVRETEEELGIKVDENEFKFLGEFIHQKGWELVQTYVLKKDIDLSKVKLQVEEVSEIKWVSLGGFKKLINSKEFCFMEKEYRDWLIEKINKEMKRMS